MGAAAPSRRDRMRLETANDIKAAARQLLVSSGPGGVVLRAIAREVGMTAPAIYRYFPSLDELIAALIVDCYDELVAVMGVARDARPARDLGGRLVAVSRAFRSWSVRHPAEFGLIFGAPPPGFSAPPDGITESAGARFSAVFQDLFVGIWTDHGVPLPQRGTLDPRLTRQLRDYARVAAVPLPPAALYLFLACWVRIYGVVAMEVFGHLRWAVADGEALFETELRQLAHQLGIASSYRPPATRNR